MPASRSRTERYQDCLRQIQERGGGIELALKDGANNGADLLWRVRLLRVSDEELVVEPPSAAGAPIRLPEQTGLIGCMAVGQNRWMFHTRVVGQVSVGEAGRAPVPGIRLAAPERVERCRRRAFLRISTASLSLPSVECWPLIDPTSVMAAEVANAALVRHHLRTGQPWTDTGEPLLLPEVGPPFRASLANLSGGGVGLLLGRNDAPGLDRARLFWIRINLTPGIPAPIGVTARLAHTHPDSQGNVYAGMAFEFQFNPAHRAFVVDQVCRYVENLRSLPGAAAA